MCVCEYWVYTTHIYINKPPNGTRNHHHHHWSISAILSFEYAMPQMETFRTMVEPTHEGEYYNDSQMIEFTLS